MNIKLLNELLIIFIIFIKDLGFGGCKSSPLDKDIHWIDNPYNYIIIERDACAKRTRGSHMFWVMFG